MVIEKVFSESIAVLFLHTLRKAVKQVNEMVEDDTTKMNVRSPKAKSKEPEKWRQCVKQTKEEMIGGRY